MLRELAHLCRLPCKRIRQSASRKVWQATCSLQNFFLLHIRKMMSLELLTEINRFSHNPACPLQRSFILHQILLKQRVVLQPNHTFKMCPVSSQHNNKEEMPVKCVLHRNEVLAPLNPEVSTHPVRSLVSSGALCDMKADRRRCPESDAQLALPMGRKFGLSQDEHAVTAVQDAKKVWIAMERGLIYTRKLTTGRRFASASPTLRLTPRQHT